MKGKREREIEHVNELVLELLKDAKAAGCLVIGEWGYFD